MLDYRSLRRACKELKLNPNKFGENSSTADSIVVGTFPKPFDLETIKFPKKESEQVLLIGQIIYNLTSQTSFIHSYNLTNAKGKEQLRIDEEIGRIMPILQESLNFWLELGLKKCKCKKDLISHNGRVYEIDPHYVERMAKFDEGMRKVRQEFNWRSHSSEIDAGKIILS